MQKTQVKNLCYAYDGINVDGSAPCTRTSPLRSLLLFPTPQQNGALKPSTKAQFSLWKHLCHSICCDTCTVILQFAKYGSYKQDQKDTNITVEPSPGPRARTQWRVLLVHRNCAANSNHLGYTFKVVKQDKFKGHNEDYIMVTAYHTKTGTKFYAVTHMLF